VYVDGSALRRRRLAAAAPQQLVAALRRRRTQFPPATLAADAPAPRVRRALAWMNGLVAAATLATSIISAVFVLDKGVFSVWWWQADGQSAENLLMAIAWFSCIPAVITVVFSAMAGSPRGAVMGGSSIAFLMTLAICDEGRTSASPEADAGVAAVVLLAVRLLTLASTVAALLLPRRTWPVQWATFQKRNRIAFAVATGVVMILALAVIAVNTTEMAEGSIASALSIVASLGLLAGGSVVSAAAYFAGVRLIPLGAGVMVILVGLLMGSLGAMFVAVLLTFGCFYLQLRRTADHPPVDFWETRWRRWKWPLAVLAVVATVVLIWQLSGEWTVAFVVGAFPATIALLNLINDLATDRFAGLVQRLGSWLPLHLD
jgi:hypothetical protein